MLVRYFFFIHLGDGEDYLNLALKDGGISLSINLQNFNIFYTKYSNY